MQLQWKLENKVWNFTRLLPNKVNECQQDTIYFSPWNQSSIEVWTDWSTANTLQETVIIDLTKNQVEEMMICFRGATPTQKWKNLQKMAVTLTSQKSPLRVSLSLSHTHIGLVIFRRASPSLLYGSSPGDYPQHRHINSDDFGGHLVLRIEDQERNISNKDHVF